MQRRFRLAVARDVDDTDAAGIVRPTDIVHITEHKVIVMDIHAVASLHADVTFHAVVLAKGNTDYRHRDAKVTQHHAPVTAGKMAQATPKTVAMSSAFVQFHQRQDNDPDRHNQPHHRHTGDAVLQQPRQQD
ncbi:hypothetical protein D3C73_1193860 [compost metagenome]